MTVEEIVNKHIEDRLRAINLVLEEEHVFSDRWSEFWGRDRELRLLQAFLNGELTVVKSYL